MQWRVDHFSLETKRGTVEYRERDGEFVVRDHLEEIDQLQQTLAQKRPFPANLLKTITQKFREEWTYHTNAIEGSTFTLQETAFFLREGLTIKGKTLREHLEVVNHVEAIDYLEQAIRERDISEALIKSFHAILFQGIKPWTGGVAVEPGVYKKQDNHVLTPSGRIHYYTPALQVVGEMEKLIHWYKNNGAKKHPVELAAIFHHRLVAIHPFLDGNGRVSRLMMNFILLKAGYPPAVIRNENRIDYYLALEEADQGNEQPFSLLLANEVRRSLKTMCETM
jgi:Fic family protein